MQNVSNISNMPQPVMQQQPYYGTTPATPPNPNYAGVNIQIFNPMVGSPSGSIYPSQTNSAYNSGTQGGCYPAGYYTGQYPAGTFVPQNPYGTTQNSGTYDTNGIYYPQNPNGYPVPGTTAAQTQSTASAPEQQGNTPVSTGQETTKNEDSTIKNNQPANETEQNPETTDSDKNAQNPDTSVKNDTADKTEDKSNTVTDKDAKKTEKRKIVELSDDYIKTLENYLNSQDSEVRLMGAKEVVNRAMEDDSRKDDAALTALVNKMLQDPSSAIRAVALSLIDSRTILGDDYTVNVLKKMQTSKDGYGQDSVQATSALLKMAGKTIEKEFEVKETPKTDKK